jgi:hypothetical protein
MWSTSPAERTVIAPPFVVHEVGSGGGVVETPWDDRTVVPTVLADGARLAPATGCQKSEAHRSQSGDRERFHGSSFRAQMSPRRHA